MNWPSNLGVLPSALEAALVLGVTAVVILLLLRRSRGLGRLQLYLMGAALIVVLLTLQSWRREILEPAMVQTDYLASLPQPPRDGGYVSSDTCRACHPDEYNSWHRTYHRTMTQVASPETVIGDFNDVTLRHAGQRFHLRRDGDEFWVDIHAADAPPGAPPNASGRIGLLTGAHHMQAYWLTTDVGNMQLDLPFYWLKETQSWVPARDTFLKDPNAQHPSVIWNQACIRCHATGGQPRPASLNDVFETRVGELGIACEACHGPAEEHVRANRDPRRRYALHLAGEGDPTIVNPARLDSRKASMICGDCHNIKYFAEDRKWLQEGFQYRPGGDLEETTPSMNLRDPAKEHLLAKVLQTDTNFVRGAYWSDGMVRVSGRDYNGMINAPCFQRGELSCLSCHSMHHSDPKDQLAARMETNEACFQCHGDFRDKLADHTRHAPESAGSLCYNCHMPHTVYGLLKNIRSHLISSPTVAETRATGRPNACNLCHLDQTLAWTGEHLREWYGQEVPELSPEERTVSLAVRQILSGDAGQRAIMGWHLGWTPAQETAGTDWMAPFLALLLDDPYSAVRFIGRRSLRTLPEYRELDYDAFGNPLDRRRTAQEVRRRWETRPNPLRQGEPALLLLDDGRNLQATQVGKLLERRDNTPMTLEE
ncbi:MAG TPA: C cytochrome precursor [Verrucomicrobiales bacterium]|nr:C cytochrome precursor [Verrucomicrobiales bacterium]